MPNAFATLTLVLWPFVSVLLFRRLPVGRALIGCLLLAYLFLPTHPTGFDLPFLPLLGKDVIPAVSALVICASFYRDKLDILPASIMARVFIVLFILSPLATTLTNSDPIQYTLYVQPGMRIREAVPLMFQNAFLVLPLLLARRFLASAEDQRDMLWALLFGALIYALPMMVEVVLSPQLNIWFYGYFQHIFSQMVRGDAYRPIVFLNHGLHVAFFTMTATLAAAALARTHAGKTRVQLVLATVFLFAMLALCRSLGSMIYAIVLLPVVLVFGLRMQLMVALSFAVLVLAYPVLREADAIPTDQILAIAHELSPERENSLAIRFNNEAALLERASERPVFGWGMWARNQIIDPTDGRILSISDGHWVIVIGAFGWLGFVAKFGLLTLPIFMLWTKSVVARPPLIVLDGDKTAPRSVPLEPAAVVLSVLLGVNLADLIPNASITPLTWLMAGALLGYAEHARQFALRPQRPAFALRTVL